MNARAAAGRADLRFQGGAQWAVPQDDKVPVWQLMVKGGKGFDQLVDSLKRLEPRAGTEITSARLKESVGRYRGP